MIDDFSKGRRNVKILNADQNRSVEGKHKAIEQFSKAKS